jgi:putative DNA primase/helicase
MKSAAIISKNCPTVNQKSVSDDRELFTDLGNAKRLVRLHGKDLRYCHPWKKWLAWDGKRWAVDDTGEAERRAKLTVRSMYAEAANLVERLAKEHDEERRAKLDKRYKELLAWAKRSESAARLKDMLALARSERGVPVLPAQLDADPWLLNVANGTVGLRTGAFRGHRREDLLTKLAPVRYDPAAACPRWGRFVGEIMDGDADLAGYLRRLAGYCLTGDVSEQALFFLYGDGANGKSTFVNVLHALLGGYAGQAAPELLTARKGERHPTELADLFGRRLVSTVETDEGERFAEALLKQLTGGDPVKARRCKEDFWQFDPTHKLLLLANHKPTVRGNDHGMWRRIKLIPFTVTFGDDGPRCKDPALLDKLKAELPGVLNWALAGCREWQEHGLGEPGQVRQATAEYREEQDAVGRFLGECCQVGSDEYRVVCSALYATYAEWCDRGREQRLSNVAFSKRLQRDGYDNSSRNGRGQYQWRGIGLPTPAVEAPEDLWSEAAA